MITEGRSAMDPDHNTYDRIWEITLKLMVPIFLAVNSWVMYSLLDHSERLTAIEANRFNARDAYELEKDWNAKHQVLQAQISIIQRDTAVTRSMVEEIKSAVVEIKEGRK